MRVLRNSVSVYTEQWSLHGQTWQTQEKEQAVISCKLDQLVAT